VQDAAGVPPRGLPAAHRARQGAEASTARAGACAVTPAVLALLALLVAIGVSMTARVNVGLLAIALAWAIGVFAAHMKAEAVIAAFPSALFVTLAGVTFLFAIGRANGTLDLIASRATRLVRGNAGLLPWVSFSLACVLSTIG